MEIGDKLRNIRKENKLTLKEVSLMTGISISFISDIENKRRNPSVETLKILADAFGIPASELLEGNSISNDNPDVLNGLDEDVKDIMLKINKLSKENKKKALKMLDIFFEEK
jgi:transcriptional regulator with XRE-family HTH domain